MIKRATGLSPREYQSARRMQQVKHGLRKGDDVTTALYDAGFGSPSRLYEKSSQQLGMTPGTYRRGGAGLTIQYAIVPSPLGRLLVAATSRGLCAVRFGESMAELEEALRKEFAQSLAHHNVEHPDCACNWRRQGRTRRGSSVRQQPRAPRCAVPSGGTKQRRLGRLPLGRRTQEETARTGAAEVVIVNHAL